MRAPVPVTEEEREAGIERVRSYLEGRGTEALRQDWSRIPEVKPAVQSMFVARNGDLWVSTSSADGLQWYDVFDREGRHRGSAATEMPVRSQPQPVVRGDRFWAVVTDEFDVPYVVRGRLAGREST